MHKGAILVLIIGTTLCTAAPVARAWPLLAQNWRDLSPKERYDALQNYRRHEQLPEDRQRDIEKHYERWQGMSSDERDRVRQNFERLHRLPPEERERFQRKYQKWKQQGDPQR